MNKATRSFRNLLLVIASALLIAPLALYSAEHEPVFVGFDGEYGLKNSTSAQAIELGLRVAINEINAQGGVLGGRPLELVTKDNRSVPSRGVANIKALAQIPDLVAVVGGRFSPVLLQQIDLVHELKLPLLDAWGAANGVTDHTHKPSYTFRLSLRDSWAMPAMLKQLTKKGKKRIGVLLPNTGWGRSNKQALTKAITHHPQLTVVDIIWYNFGQKQMLPKYQQLLDKGADALLMVANDNEGSKLIRELAANPSVPRLPIVSHWGVTGGHMVEASGPLLHQIDFSVVQTFSFFTAQSSTVEQFMKGARKISAVNTLEQLDSPVGTAHAYDLMHILAIAIDRAASTDRATIRDALESDISYQGLVRNYAPAFTPDNHDALTEQQVFMARFREDGVIVPLD